MPALDPPPRRDDGRLGLDRFIVPLGDRFDGGRFGHLGNGASKPVCTLQPLAGELAQRGDGADLHDFLVVLHDQQIPVHDVLQLTAAQLLVGVARHLDRADT